jgi:hypothetical protein
MRATATSARIAATITRIAVALISASSNCPGSLHSRAEIPLQSGSAMIASLLFAAFLSAFATKRTEQAYQTNLR